MAFGIPLQHHPTVVMLFESVIEISDIDALLKRFLEKKISFTLPSFIRCVITILYA